MKIARSRKNNLDRLSWIEILLLIKTLQRDGSPQREVMATRKFKVGQLVRIQKSSAQTPKENFKIVLLMPADQQDIYQYRIQSSLDSHQRMAKETDLSL